MKKKRCTYKARLLNTYCTCSHSAGNDTQADVKQQRAVWSTWSWGKGTCHLPA